MKELLKVNTPALTLASLLGFARNINSKYSSSFWNKICEHLENPNLESKPISDKKGAKQRATAEQTLVPKVLELDADGRPIAEHEKVNQNEAQTVETIPWTVWANEEMEPNTINKKRKASGILWMAHESVHSTWTTVCPIPYYRSKNGQCRVCPDNTHDTV